MLKTEYIPFHELQMRYEGHVAIVEFARPPHNYFTLDLLVGLAEAFEYLDGVPDVRVIIMASKGKSFCAGADFNDPHGNDPLLPGMLYRAGIRLFRIRKPIIAAIQGAAVGGGLGLALTADFRVAAKDARFAANFARLGIHPGFGLSATLPRLIGAQQTAMLLYTGRRLKAREAVDIGLADLVATSDDVMDDAMALAQEMASSAPLAVQSIRETLRMGLAEAVETALAREAAEQEWQMCSADFAEGVRAMTERRAPVFMGK
ncbi:MAG TPA: enoyl-CoA hydratase/isomerase family protein [Candidimonas sp.]|nr:enoyl-CoA hydratase/isomerase family protein [Candidimonas sp.]